MNTILVLYPLLFFALVGYTLGDILEEMDKAFNLCSTEFKTKVDEIVSPSKNLTCFDTCLALKAEIIKDKKFNLDKYITYLNAIEDPEYAKKVVKAYTDCVERDVEMRDECEFMTRVDKCIDKKLGEEEKAILIL